MRSNLRNWARLSVKNNKIGVRTKSDCFMIEYVIKHAEYEYCKITRRSECALVPNGQENDRRAPERAQFNVTIAQNTWTRSEYKSMRRWGRSTIGEMGQRAWRGHSGVKIWLVRFSRDELRPHWHIHANAWLFRSNLFAPARLIRTLYVHARVDAQSEQ